MDKIEYLYGVKEAYWHHLPYDRALKLKIDLAYNIIKSIHDKPFKDVTNEDTIRKNACIKAISFNEGLLSE